MRFLITATMLAAGICSSTMSDKAHASLLRSTSIPQFNHARACNGIEDVLAVPGVALKVDLKNLASKFILVAKEADFYVLGDNGDLKIHSRHNFTKGQSSSPEIVCAQSKKDFKERFSFLAPLLIDLSEKQKVGSSLWSFQVVADAEKFSVMNQKSPRSLDYQKDLALQTNSDIQAYQLSHGEVEIQYLRLNGNSKQKLSVKYDLLKPY